MAVAAGAVYLGYDYFKAGLHTRPEMPPGAFSLSYKSGLRAIMIGVPDERETRRYFGFPADVPFYLEDVWSFCYAPNAEEAAMLQEFMSNRDFPGERLEAICKIEVDDETVIRGFVTTVPKL